MNDSEDRIAVPTNGHRPPLSTEAPAAAALDPALTAPALTAPAATAPAPAGGLSTDELRVAFTPGQVAAGFGIIAALILLVVGRRRGRRG